MHVHLEDVHAGRARLEVRQHVERQAKSIDRRLSAIETQLKGKLRVEVMNFPQPKAEGKD